MVAKESCVILLKTLVQLLHCYLPSAKTLLTELCAIIFISLVEIVPFITCQDSSVQMFALSYLLETLCPEVWMQRTELVLNNQIFKDDPGLRLPNCSDTDELVRFLNMTDDCCTNAGVVLPNGNFI